MSSKKKKDPATVGTVLHKIKDPATLKPWVDYMVSVDPWKALEIQADRLLESWVIKAKELHFFSALLPKQTPVFENEYGLVVFKGDGAKAVIEEKTKTAFPAGLEDGAFIHAIVTKVRHKGVGKYLLGAAERVLSETQSRVFLFVSESNLPAQRFYKGLGYEEVARVQDYMKPGNTELVFMKDLTD